ncbi:MAG: molybdenum cofactor guanylyltransferase MobA, partial [Pseudomonadota bacterium]
MIDANNIMGAIIAGGQATRMNKENKALKLLAGKPLVEHIASRLAPSVGTLIINANRDANEFSAIGSNILAQDIAIISDVVDLGAGPLAGLLQSLLYARKSDYSHLATVAGDTPFFPADLVSRLAKEAQDKNTIVIAKSGGFPQPIFGLWPVSLVDDLNNWLSSGNTNKVMAWVRTHAHRFAEF